MKRKNIIILFIGLFIILLLMLLNGISFVNLNRIFSTKYYNTAIEAFESDYETEIGFYNVQIDDILYEYNIDENNVLLFVESKDNKLVVIQFHKKNNKYFYWGFHFVVNVEYLYENSTFSNDEYRLYDNDGIYIGNKIIKINVFKNNIGFENPAFIFVSNEIEYHINLIIE